MRLMLTSAWSRMRRREEQALKLVSAGRHSGTNLQSASALAEGYSSRLASTRMARRGHQQSFQAACKRDTRRVE
jgi:hypothetical protein